MIDRMSTVRISESDLARGLHEILERVERGDEVIVERDHRAVAVIRTPGAPGRKIADCIIRAKAFESALGFSPSHDTDFSKDVDAAIAAHREPLHPPAWD